VAGTGDEASAVEPVRLPIAWAKGAAQPVGGQGRPVRGRDGRQV